MLIQLLVSISFLFLLLVLLVLFFIRHQSKVPYYRLTQDQCVTLLKRALQGILPEYEWHAFIGMTVRDDDVLDELREQCLLIDEYGVKGTQLINGRLCMCFNKQGLSQLEILLDEWQHKSNYTV
ncbi:hypothetical protein HGG82_10765 [Marinomonas sp. M1K-6]|uniref:Uncharacterized protein n=1 Tax=Marinomonas profundi TaxID=2726122 RepID=A0A847R2L0_9GAMM|nr:hypothetical protein [Marinomonas profundi]NLQ18101.1 hypothetical protein [Marinomonas profundi]UDV04115.1 hypothetical protein J8N69_04960 [Marinomonas profundi]